ncbi:heavy metal translocating P-type ATPase [Clostridium sp.]|uniref:heavy metal translocating P-type ATPase n=1 Tax=Clostridium sp. TaxID=1506 RepID=UPI003A5B95BB
MYNSSKVKLSSSNKIKTNIDSENIVIIEGLDCSNCASKIEDKVKNMPKIKAASLDFLSKKLKFQVYNETEISDIIEDIKNIVNKIEPDAQVIYKEDDEKHIEETSIIHNKKLQNFILIFGVLIYIACIIFRFSYWTEFTLYLISYLIIGWNVLFKAFKNILNGQVFDENFLMSIASIGAFTIGQYPESIAVMLFYRIGDHFQDKAVDRSRRSIASLMDIKPDFANVETKEGFKKIKPEYVNIGDIILIKPGEKIPLDGEVIEGNSMADTSALTGESLPKEINVGDSVLSGYINESAVLKVKVSKNFSESTVSKILDMVENASSKKAPTEKFITKFARYYTPAVVILALVIAIFLPVITGDDFSKWLYRSLEFLVVSCPCAIVISVPLGFFGGIGAASKNGILVKGGNYLEALNDVDTIVFDKTGTLTKGIFKVTDIVPKNGLKRDELLRYAAFAESYTNHPIGRSIVKEYNKNIDKKLIENYREISGKGISATIDGKQILVGNGSFMESNNLAYSKVDSIGTIVHVAVDSNYIGYIVIADEVKKDSKFAIEKLKEAGIKKTVMLTGDNKKIGKFVGNKLKLDEVYTDLLPNDKLEKLDYIYDKKHNSKKVAFVGDGINDSPVLARADVGIAMGGIGSDAAIEAADIVIMTDEPSKIVTAMKISNKTKIIVSENIVFSLGVKLAIIVLAAFGMVSMWVAVFGDVGVALIAVFNSMRTLKIVK